MSIYKKMVVLAMASAFGIVAEAVPLIREGVVWEYENTLYRPYGSYDMHTFRMRFEGTETVDDKEYSRLILESCIDLDGNDVAFPYPYESWFRPDGSGGTEPVLMRESEGKVYMILPEVFRQEHGWADDEVLLYDFTGSIGDEYAGYLFDPDCQDKYCDYLFNVASHEYALLDNDMSLIRTLSVDYGEGFGLPFQWTVGEGLGVVKGGFLSAPVMPCQRTGAIVWDCNLRRMYNAEGDVIFDSGIKTTGEKCTDIATDNSNVYEYVFADADFRHGELVSKKFEGMEKVNGKEYHRFVTTRRLEWTQRETPEGVPMNQYEFVESEVTDAEPSLIRTDRGCLYLLLSEDAGEGDDMIPAGTEIRIAELEVGRFIHGRESEIAYFEGLESGSGVRKAVFSNEYGETYWPSYYPPYPGYNGGPVVNTISASDDEKDCIHMVEGYGLLTNGTLDHPMSFKAQERCGVYVYLNNVYGADGGIVYEGANCSWPLPDVLAGVDMTDSESDCAVEYYTLQGVRVTTPSKGDMLIRRQGTKVSKVIIGAKEW